MKRTVSFLRCSLLPALVGVPSLQWYNGAGLVDGEVAGLANDFSVRLGAGKFYWARAELLSKQLAGLA